MLLERPNQKSNLNNLHERNVPKREYHHAANAETTPPWLALGWSLPKLPEALGSDLDLRPEPKLKNGSIHHDARPQISLAAEAETEQLGQVPNCLEPDLYGLRNQMFSRFRETIQRR